MIPQTIKNLAADPDISGIIPRAFNALQVVAAATATAQQLAGHEEPNRHHFLEAVPAYLKRLPNSVPLALEVVSMDAALVLGIPGLATDQAQLSEAQSKLANAQAEVDAAEAIQGRRLARIHRLETEIEQANRELEAWQIDFDGVIASQELAILENFGKHSVNGCFERIASMNILRRLAPKATAALKARIGIAEKELAGLRAAAPEAKRSRTPAEV